MMIVYKTKSSLLIKLLFLAVLVFTLIVTIVEKNIALLAVTITFSAVIIYIFYNTYYTVYKNTLTIKSGFLFNEEINIHQIKKISRRRRNLLSGPGFSIDRLIIEYAEKEFVTISPELQNQFLEHLKRINPDIALEPNPT